MTRHIFLWVVAVVVFSGCSKETRYYTHSGVAEGTTFHIKYAYKRTLNHEIDSLLNYFEGVLSTYRDSSLISHFNRWGKDTFVVRNRLFAEMLDKAFEVYRETNGAFDITVANLVNAWGFGFDKYSEVDSSVIDSLMQFTGMNKLIWDGDALLIKKDVRLKLDDNAIAKGQSVDFIARYFDRLGIKNYLVEIGGEIRVKGLNPKGKRWVIGIDKPIDGSTEWDRELEAAISVTNKAVATSGNYRKFYIKNGVKYSHTIDPKTGYPVRHSLLSATVVADDCITADALATAFMVMGTEQVKKFLKRHPGIEVLLIYDNGGKYGLFKTPGFEKMLVR